MEGHASPRLISRREEGVWVVDQTNQHHCKPKEASRVGEIRVERGSRKQKRVCESGSIKRGLEPQ
jgi:hypothetical protein